MNIRAVIFDFDGVIINSEHVKFERLRPLLRAHNITLKKRDFSDMIGKKTSAFLKEKFHHNLSLNEIAKISLSRRKDHLKNIQEYSKPISGVKKFVRFLQKKKLKLCIATGTSRSIVKKTLRAIQLQNCFGVFVTGEEFKSSKPNPEVFKLAINKLNISQKHIVVVEDSIAGVNAAKKAGLWCAAITTTYQKKDLKRADLVVNSFKELQEKVQKMLK